MNKQVAEIKADPTGPRVYSAIAAVMTDIAVEGIAKERSNQQQGYKFRGIDDVYNALSPILSRHGLLILPRVLNREVVERQTKNGSALFYVTVEVEFSLVCAEDGSAHVIKTYGEAMDSADKATNKAMSAAFKYAAMQAFCIPTEGDTDADATTHAVAPAETKKVEAKPPTLAERADRLEATLKAIKTAPDLDKAFKLASALLADLDAKDPERLADLDALYQRRQNELAEKVAA